MLFPKATAFLKCKVRSISWKYAKSYAFRAVVLNLQCAWNNLGIVLKQICRYPGIQFPDNPMDLQWGLRT